MQTYHIFGQTYNVYNADEFFNLVQSRKNVFAYKLVHQEVTEENITKLLGNTFLSVSDLYSACNEFDIPTIKFIYHPATHVCSREVFTEPDFTKYDLTVVDATTNHYTLVDLTEATEPIIARYGVFPCGSAHFIVKQ